MSDLVTSETVTEEVQPETQVKFKKPRDFFYRKSTAGNVQAVMN